MSSQQQRVISSQVNSLPAQMRDVSKCTRYIPVWKAPVVWLVQDGA